MGTLTIGTPRLAPHGEGGRVTAALRTPEGSFDLYFDVHGARPDADASALLPAVLLPAMARGWVVRSEAPVSPRLLASLPRIQALFHSWNRLYRPVGVSAEPAGRPAPEHGPRGAASFFSGGVDSFDTLLRNRGAIGAVLFVTGFDIRPGDRVRRERATAGVRRAAAGMGVTLVEIGTNVRDFADPIVDWHMFHGSAMAGTALLLARRFRRVFVPATLHAPEAFPLGSHPDLDPLWSTETLEIVHDGAEDRRLRKVARVAGCDVALATLRVCWENPGGAYNCGRCEKCIRTMIALLLAGALDRCTVFDAPLDPGRVARLRLSERPLVLPWHMEIIRELERRGTHPDLLAALRQAVRPPPWSRRATRGVREFCRGVRRRLVGGADPI